MTIFSAQQLFSDNQAVIATAISENVIDTGIRGTPYGAAAALHGDIGKGNLIYFLAQVTTAFNTLTSLEITLETSDNADLSSSTVLWSSGDIVLASLVVGYTIPIQVLPEGVTGRYLGLRYAVTGTDPTLGKIMAGITLGNQSNFTGA